jgi:hypothetical protein
MIIEVMDPADRSSSSDLDASSDRALVKSDEGIGSRLRSIALVTAFVTATVGWLWFLITVALWLIDF